MTWEQKGLPCSKAIIHRRFAIQIAKESKLKCVCNVIYHKRYVLNYPELCDVNNEFFAFSRKSLFTSFLWLKHVER